MELSNRDERTLHNECEPLALPSPLDPKIQGKPHDPVEGRVGSHGERTCQAAPRVHEKDPIGDDPLDTSRPHPDQQPNLNRGGRNVHDQAKARTQSRTKAWRLPKPQGIALTLSIDGPRRKLSKRVVSLPEDKRCRGRFRM